MLDEFEKGLGHRRLHQAGSWIAAELAGAQAKAGAEIRPRRPVCRGRQPLDRGLQVGLELIDIGLVDDLGRHDDQLVLRDARLVALEILGHQLHALIAPLEGLLHDGAGEAAVAHGAERDRVLVEGDDGDLAELAGRLQRLVDLRRVVGIEPDHAVDLGIGRQHVVDVAAGAGEVDVVAAHVDELDALAFDRLLEAGDALLGVVGAEEADEAHALAAIRQRLDGDFAGLHAGVGVRRAEIGDAVASPARRCRW